MNGTVIIGKSRMVRVSRFLGEEKKVFVNSKGEQFFVPEALRENAEEGDYVIVIGKEYTSQGIDEVGQPKVNEAGEPVYDGAVFTRWDALLMGDHDTVALAFYEDEIMETAAKPFIADQAKLMVQGRKVAPKKAAVPAAGEPANVG